MLKKVFEWLRAADLKPDDSVVAARTKAVGDLTGRIRKSKDYDLLVGCAAAAVGGCERLGDRSTVVAVLLECVRAHQPEKQTEAKFLSPTEYQGPGGKYRWKVKMDEDAPPAGEGKNGYTITTIEEMSNWDDLADVHENSPRKGNELKWFKITGKVELVKAEEDGDLHIQLYDKDKNLSVVCEVPVGEQWNAIRKTVFGWSKVKFPCKAHTLSLNKYPTISVVGKAFWDGEHHSDKTPNRRNYDANVTVWELHPIMELSEIKDK